MSDQKYPTMTERKCSKCKKSQSNYNYEVGRKQCKKCYTRRKINKTTEDKQKIKIYLVHKDLHKHFKPQRRREKYEIKKNKKRLIELEEERLFNEIRKIVMESMETTTEVFDPETFEYY